MAGRDRHRDPEKGRERERDGHRVGDRQGCKRKESLPETDREIGRGEVKRMTQTEGM